MTSSLLACPQPSHSTNPMWWHSPDDTCAKILTENGLSTHLDQQLILDLPFVRPDCVNCPLVKAETPMVLQQALA